MTADNPLAALRNEINQIDDQLVALLARRYAILDDVIALKQKHGIPHRVEARVQEVLERNEANGQKAGLPPGYTRAIWHLIVEAAHAYERKKLPL